MGLSFYQRPDCWVGAQKSTFLSSQGFATFLEVSFLLIVDFFHADRRDIQIAHFILQAFLKVCVCEIVCRMSGYHMEFL